MRTMDARWRRPSASASPRETLDIYAPIAHRLGLNQTYRELQELSFEHLHPWRHAALAKAVQRARGYRRDIVERVQQRRREGLRRRPSSRCRSAAARRRSTRSTARCARSTLSFAQVNDIFGFRIVVPTLPECYLALGVLHQLYKPVPGRFKDYIAIPKANGYQSLHTTLVSPLGTAVEFQIRTEADARGGRDGHRRALAVQEPTTGPASGQEAQRLGAMWLQSLIDIQDETRDAAEFLEHVKIDLFPDAVYVFTPTQQDPGAAARRDAGGLRLRDPLRRRRPLRGRQGQRRAGGAAHRAAAAATWSRSSPRPARGPTRPG